MSDVTHFKNLWVFVNQFNHTFKNVHKYVKSNYRLQILALTRIKLKINCTLSFITIRTSCLNTYKTVQNKYKFIKSEKTINYSFKRPVRKITILFI